MSMPPRPAPLTTEFRDLPPAVDDFPMPLPAIPGGWTRRSWTIAGRELVLVLPATPDAFLDDAEVHRRHEADEYMPYWAYLWPASLPMAELVLKRAPWQSPSAVLELGAGVGLVGLAAVHRGDHVVFSDYEPLAAELAVANARASGFHSEGLVLDWRSPPNRQFPAIVGCELLYEHRNHELLLGVLHNMLTPDGVVWFGDSGRHRAERFFELAPKHGFDVTLYDEHLQPLVAPRFGKFQLFELRFTRDAGPR